MTPHRIVPSIVLAASLGLATQGCGLVSPTYGDLFDLTVSVENHLPVAVHVTGPGEFIPDVTPVINKDERRFINVGPRVKGDRMTFVGWSTTSIRGPEVTCELVNATQIAPAAVAIRVVNVTPTEALVAMGCGGGMKLVSNRSVPISNVPGL